MNIKLNIEISDNAPKKKCFYIILILFGLLSFTDCNSNKNGYIQKYRKYNSEELYQFSNNLNFDDSELFKELFIDTLPVKIEKFDSGKIYRSCVIIYLKWELHLLQTRKVWGNLNTQFQMGSLAKWIKNYIRPRVIGVMNEGEILWGDRFEDFIREDSNLLKDQNILKLLEKSKYFRDNCKCKIGWPYNTHIQLNKI